MPQIALSGSEPLTLDVGNALKLSDDELFELCARNRDLRIERTAEGDLIVMSPAGFKTGHRNATLTAALWGWADQNGSGAVVDSSTGFLLPSGAMRSPDGAWVLKSRLEALSAQQKEKFLPLVPDFVVELRSPSDDRAKAIEKMEEWREAGVRLGLLLDPIERAVHVYRPGVPPEVLEGPSEVSAEPELPGFVLSLKPIWKSI